LAESNDVTYEAYVSEQNLLMDNSKQPVKHPLINEIFVGKKGSNYLKLSN
jgi:heat shock protein HspQ